MTPVSIAVRKAAGRAEIEVRGEIDLTNAHQLHASAMDLLSPSPPGQLVIDFAGVTFCDVTGLIALIRLRLLTENAGTRLAVSRPQPAVARVMEVAGLNDYLRVTR
jgi:anti-anti-sigma factor